jgi:DnaJ-class molecular chaperone
MKKETDTTCPNCQGTGHTGLTNCCDASFYEESDICSQCKDHSDDECRECDGLGYIEDSAAELNAELEKGDNYNQAQKENQ